MNAPTLATLKKTITDASFSQSMSNAFNTYGQTPKTLVLASLPEPDENLDSLAVWWQACHQLFIAQQVKITALDFNGSQGQGSRSDEEEYIELTNQGPAIIDIGGWRISAGKGQDMVFKPETILMSGQSIRIYTYRHGEYSFNLSSPIWNNRGDKAMLYDGEGDLTACWAYGRSAESLMSIQFLQFDGMERYAEGDEYVELVNLGDAYVDLSNWALGGGHASDFIFAMGSVIAPRSSIRVYTNKLDRASGEYSWESKRAIWSNEGGSAYLKGMDGRLVSEYRY